MNIEQAKQEMETWKGINQTLYKQALYTYNSLKVEEPLAKQEEVIVPEEPKIEVIEEEKTEETYTHKQLKDMNKKEQIKILKELGVDKIPRLEGNRIRKILELT